MATILKHDVPATDSSPDRAIRLATFTLSDMSVQGDEYVQAVRLEAAKAVQQANAEADAIRKQAEADGRAAAMAKIDELLDERLAKQMTTLGPALEKVVKELNDSKGEWLAQWEQAALGVAKAIAERIVRRELTTDPKLTLEWVREALTLAANCSEVTVLLNPAEHEGLRNEVESLAASIAKIATAHVEADDSISSGGCRVVTKHGSIDMQIETQLDRLAEELS